MNTTNVTKTVQERAHTGTDVAAQAAHNLIDRVAQRAEGSEAALRESAQQAQQQLQRSLKSARSKSVAAKDSVNGFVRRHPLLSVGLAVGIGALLMTRGRRRALAAAQEDTAALH